MSACITCTKPLDAPICTYKKNNYHTDCCLLCKPAILETKKEEKPAPPAEKPAKPAPPAKTKSGPGKISFALLGNFEQVKESNCNKCKKKISGQKYLTHKVGEFICGDCHSSTVEKCFMCKKVFEIEEECFKDEKENKYCEKCIKIYMSTKKMSVAPEKPAAPPAKPEPPKKKTNTIHCDSCTKPISLSLLQFDDFNYHNTCFTCYKCKNALTDKHFVREKDGLACENCKTVPTCTLCSKKFAGGESLYELEQDKPYCFQCYNKIFSKACHKCCKQIDQGVTYLLFQENNYHQDCFSCSTCAKKIGMDGEDFYKNSKEDKFCHKCVTVYREKNTTEIITTWTAIISIKTREILSCASCKRDFASGESFYRGENDKPFCVECYTKLNSKPCFGCTKPIGPSQNTLIVNEKYYHSDCLKCQKCSKVLTATDELYLVGEDKFACSKCIH